jgi:hypothetical protein
VSIPLSGRPSLFLSARSWVDSTGSGIPDWWQLEYFGAVGVDPYSDPAGEGWTLLQDYLNGWNPTNYYTPPVLQGVCVSSDASGNNVISWNPPEVAPDTFTIQRNTGSGWQTIATIAGNLSSYTDVNPPAGASYQVSANYPKGSSAYASAGSPSNINPSLTLPATVASGPGGRLFLLTATPSITVTGLLVTATPAPSDHPKDGIETVAPQYPSTNFYGINSDVSGVVNATSLQGIPLRLNTGFTPLYGSYGFWLQTFTANGIWGNPVQSNGPADATPFLDGRQHMLDNLNFALRAAPASQPFDFYFPAYPYVGAGECYGIFPAYTTAGFSWAFADNDDLLYRQDILDPFLPFENDSVLRAFCFTANRFDSYGNPLDVGYDGLPTMNTWDYYFSSFACAESGTTNVPPRQLDSDTAQYIFYGPATDWQDVPDLGMTWDATIPGWRVSSNPRNVYGLRILSVLCAKVTQTPQPVTFFTAQPGGIIPALGTTSQPGTGWLYVQAENPVFRNAGFHFIPSDNSSSTALAGPGWYYWTGVPNTNSLVAVVGTQASFYLWARLAVSNAYPNTISYLEEYFDTACKINASGLVTTNQTGLLSEYGSFFPTEPGPVALVTKPDPATGQTYTGVVQVISLNLDANHDGVMDTTFYGSDFTSADKSYIFWINNNYDRFTLDSDGVNYYDDDVSSTSQAAKSPYTGVPTPDYNYTNGAGNRAIPCVRDLQDFARLWVSGVTTNLLAAVPPGSAVTLSWGSVSGSPTIDLFVAADADGGMGYLTNGAIATNQINASLCPYIGRLAPGGSIQLNASTFTNHWAGDYFIWCGVTNGTGQLNLTIAQGGTNVLWQTSVYIQLVDIKQMYERWTVGDRPSYPPTSVAALAGEDLPQPFYYTNQAPAGTPYILYVHGWNLETWEKDRWAEAAFKRLYWQGYQGRFGEFRWPTTYDFTGSFWQLVTDTYNYNNGESNAWTSATGLLNKLNDLNAKYPGQVYLLAHSMGNIVAGEALRLAGTNQVVNTYVASQAAIPAHVYDSTVTNTLQFSYQYPSGLLYALGSVNYGPFTPNIYGNWFAGNSGGTGRRVSFFNGNDFALAMPRWGFDQVVKPDVFVFGKYAYLGSPNDPSPWNHFVFEILGATNYFDIVNNVNDRYEVMSYAAQARSTALGATPGITNLVNLDLTTVWPTDSSGHNYTDHFWHSAEFRGDCWQEWSYWNTLLFSSKFGFNIPNP